MHEWLNGWVDIEEEREIDGWNQQISNTAFTCSTLFTGDSGYMLNTLVPLELPGPVDATEVSHDQGPEGTSGELGWCAT